MATQYFADNNGYTTNVTREKLASLTHLTYFEETSIQLIGFRPAKLTTRLANAFDCSAALITRFRINRAIDKAARIDEKDGPAFVAHYHALDARRRKIESRIKARFRKIIPG